MASSKKTNRHSSHSNRAASRSHPHDETTAPSPSFSSQSSTPTHTTYESFSDLVHTHNGHHPSINSPTSPHHPTNRKGSFGSTAAKNRSETSAAASSPRRGAGFLPWASSASSAASPRSRNVSSSSRTDEAPANGKRSEGEPREDNDDEEEEEEEEDDDTSSRRIANGIMRRNNDNNSNKGNGKATNAKRATTTTTTSSVPKKELSTFDLMKLTFGLAGAQLTWTIELAFGTPYLLSLGLSKRSTSLVWLAGPLAGLIVQPVVGALSDVSKSKYRRRAFIAGSAIMVIISTLFVAYARELAELLSIWSGLGDWDPKQEEKVKQIAIAIGVVGFYLLDFSLNGLQASLRALILDQSPRHQQNVANAWHGRMTHFANIFGYGAGYIDLGHWSALKWVGGGQFRKLAVISCSTMAICVGVTCWTQVEKVSSRRKSDQSSEPSNGIVWSSIFGNVKTAIKDLPLPVRRVCYMQLLNWMAWFPFLFYATSYVAETFYSSLPPGEEEPDSDTATRAGSLALLLYAIVALASGAFLPFLTSLGRINLIDRSISRHSRTGRFVRTMMTKLTPRNMWTFGSALYAFGMIATFWTSSVRGATFLIAFLGIPWAVTCWVPFALVMESIREIAPSRSSSSSQPRSDEQQQERDPEATLSTNEDSPFSASKRPPPFRAAVSRQSSTLNFSARDQSQQRRNVSQSLNECSPLLSPSSRTEEEDVDSNSGSEDSSGGRSVLTGGTILGIHNLACCVPQFFVAIIASIIFSILSSSSSSNKPSNDSLSSSFSTTNLDRIYKVLEEGSGGGGDGLNGSNDVVWVLRFGGLSALLACIVSRWLIETRSEREYKEFVLRWDDDDDDVDAEEEEGAE